MVKRERGGSEGKGKIMKWQRTGESKEEKVEKSRKGRRGEEKEKEGKDGKEGMTEEQVKEQMKERK